MTKLRGFGILLGCVVLAAACESEGPLGPPVRGALRFVDIDVGYFHTCALTARGAAYCWGGNSAGMLGDGTTQARDRPTRVVDAEPFVAIDVGAGHSCALDDDGAAWCWGHNDEGQLGDGTKTPRLKPTRVAGGHTFVSISAGHAHVCALDDDGDAWCWGDDSSGQLGNGQVAGEPNSSVPVRVSFPGAWADVRAGFYQTCGLDESGAAWCWGSNDAGQNGDGTDSTRHAPVAVQGDATFRSIAPGELFVCGIEDDDDDVLCWGANRRGELAETPPSERRAPFDTGVDGVAVTASSGEHTVGGARAYACAIRRDDRATCWGGSLPELRTESAEPAALPGSPRLRELVAGPQFVCGLRTDGYAYCGGAGSAGQLGTGDRDDRAELVPVVGPE